MKNRKWFGYAHTSIVPGPGDLALFCAACPQPNVNLPDNWQQDSNQWIFTRELASDGNFSLDLLKSRADTSPIWLTNGTGFMVETNQYKAHLEVAKEVKDVRL